MVKIKGLEALNAKLVKIQALAEIKVAKAVESKLRLVFTDLVKSTPQYTGNLVSNWYIELGDKASYHAIPGYAPPGAWNKMANPYQMGSPQAVTSTVERELPKLNSLREYLFRGADHIIRIINTTPYAEEVEDGKGPHGLDIRSVNIPDYHLVAMKGYIVTKYGKMKYNGK